MYCVIISLLCVYTYIDNEDCTYLTFNSSPLSLTDSDFQEFEEMSWRKYTLMQYRIWK